MKLEKIYKAINEGLKKSLIDFGNDTILKSQLIQNKKDALLHDIDDWLNCKKLMDPFLYKLLCDEKNIGIYEVDNVELLTIIIYLAILTITIQISDTINLNWIDISNIDDTHMSDMCFDFEDCNNVFKLDISKWQLNKIPDYMFMDSCISDIKLPPSITSIGESAFSGCTYLKTIKIPKNVISIGESAFGYCKNLVKISFNGKLQSIREWAFHGCISLKSIVIPNNVRKLNAYTFAGCSGLEKITLPSSVLIIEELPFSNCPNLKDIIYNGTIKQWINIKKREDSSKGLPGSCIVHCIGGDTQDWLFH